MSETRKTHPPRFADRFIGWFCKGELLEEILGDLYEYHEELADKPHWKRSLFYWFHVVNFLRPELIKRFSRTQKLNHYGMLKLFLKVASRNFLRQRLITSMSLLSLVAGALCFHLVYAWIHNEKDMDQFHRNIDRIHMSVARTNPLADYSPLSLQLLFDLDFSQFSHIEKTLVVHVYREDEIRVITGNRAFHGKGFVADSTFFDFFDFQLERGDVGVLSDPTHIVLSRPFADRVFGKADPIGKMIEIRCDQVGTYQVAGVVEKIPSNSSLEFDFLVPRHSQRFWRRIPQEFFLTDPFFDPVDFNQQIAKMGQSNPRFPESVLSSIPFRSIYFERPFNLNLFAKYGDTNSVNTMTFIACMILLITLLSFTHLQATVQLSGVKKTGIKQVIGASRRDLCIEIVVTQLCYLLVATTIAYLIFTWVFPIYTSVMEVNIDSRPLFDLTSIGIVNVFILAISTFIAMSRIFKVKTQEALGSKRIFLKIPKMQRLLTTIQYTITIVLLIATAVVFVQFRYMLNKETGLDHRSVISVDFFEIMNGNRNSEKRKQAMAKHQYVLDQMQQNPDILHVSQGDMPVSSIASPTSWKVTGQDGYTTQNRMFADPAYADLLEIEVVEGRFFSDSLDESGQLKAVINEAARDHWEIDDLPGAGVSSNTSGREELSFQVIGVVRDYHYEHLSHTIKPLILLFSPYEDQPFLLKVQPGKEKVCIAFLEELYREVNPHGIFTYELLEDKVTTQYAKEKRIGKVYLAFTIVALLLSSIGLFTFALYETRRRTKEIGIRKVNGAGISRIFSLLSYSFLRSILLAFAVACPVAWYLMRSWLDHFAYRTSLYWWVFVLAGLLAVFIALLAVSWQTWDAARKNPVQSLRSE